MINLRPHSLRYNTTLCAGHYDENGDWHEAVVGFSEPIACRYEPNGKANTIATPDGRAYTYSYVAYIDNSISKDFKYGDTIGLFDSNGQQVAEKTVLGFHRGQLDARIWI